MATPTQKQRLLLTLRTRTGSSEMCRCLRPYSVAHRVWPGLQGTPAKLHGLHDCRRGVLHDFMYPTRGSTQSQQKLFLQSCFPTILSKKYMSMLQHINSQILSQLKLKISQMTLFCGCCLMSLLMVFRMFDVHGRITWGPEWFCLSVFG